MSLYPEVALLKAYNKPHAARLFQCLHNDTEPHFLLIVTSSNMNTVEKGVANDPRPDAGLGRLDDSTTNTTTNNSKNVMDVNNDLEAQSKEQRKPHNPRRVRFTSIY
jgi:hypothetical protein